MKIKHLTILFFVAAVTFFSCTDKKEQALVRRWRVSDVLFMDDKKSTVKSDSMQGNMIQMQRAVLKDVLMKNLYEFKDDGSYITGNAAALATGKWKIKGNNIEFISDSDKEKNTKKIPYEVLTEDSCVLVLNNDQTSFKLKLLLVPVE